MFKHKGFTLVELLVVVGIIGVLVAIALPNFARFKDRAKETQAKSNASTIQQALERYAVDNDGYYPAWLYGGDISDSYTVPQWMFEQRITMGAGLVAGSTKITKVPNWMTSTFPAAGDGDALMLSGQMEAYPKNPFIGRPVMDGLNDSVTKFNQTSIVAGGSAPERNVGGISNNRMFELSGGPPQVGIRNHVGGVCLRTTFDTEFAYNAGGKTATATPISKSVNPRGYISGNFYYYSDLNINNWGLYDGTRVNTEIDPPPPPVLCKGYKLFVYGSVNTGQKGVDVYDAFGEVEDHFRVAKGAAGDPPAKEPHNNGYNGGLGGPDGVYDSVIVTLSSSSAPQAASNAN